MRLLFRGGPWANRLLDSAVTTPPAFVAPVGEDAGVYRRTDEQPDSPAVVYDWSPDAADTPSRTGVAGLAVGREAREAMRVRFALEALAAAGALALAILTLFSRKWMEVVFRFGADQGSGALEWSVVLALFALSIGLTVVARRQWRHLTALT